MLKSNDLAELLSVLPGSIKKEINERDCEHLIEVVLDLGRSPELRFFDHKEIIRKLTIKREDLRDVVEKIGAFSGDNRAGIESTLHRISCIRNRTGEVIGLTCRVGRVVSGTIRIIDDLVASGESILLLGRPGVGKTTALREIAKTLADDYGKRVVIVDTSNEIAGDGDIPHEAIGSARRMPVSQPELQHKVMIEAVENHTPEVIVIDEIGTELEAMAAKTIAERGVQLIGTAHGNYLENLIKNPTLNHLVGGIQSVTLGDEEARRRGTQKTILERECEPTFTNVVEMHERDKWAVYKGVSVAVDEILRGRSPSKQIRSSVGGKVVAENVKSDALADFNNFVRFHVYPFGIPEKTLKQAVQSMQGVEVVHKISDADGVIYLANPKKNVFSIREAAENRGIPFCEVKQNSPQHIRSSIQSLAS